MFRIIIFRGKEDTKAMDFTPLIKKYPNIEIKKNEPLSRYTYTKTGGPAEVLFIPKSIDELVSIIKWVKSNQYSVMVIGEGSNLIIRDGGILGVTVILKNLNNIIIEGDKIIAESGATLIEVSNRAFKGKLTGLEFACGIPGSVGGAVFMNAGAYGGEVKDIIESVTVLTLEGEVIELSNDDMMFSYRYSKLMDTNYIVLKVRFSLVSGNLFKIKYKMLKLTYYRTSKQPLNYPSCGSVFKNSPDHYTGRLIKSEGLQGMMYGGAQISEKHPNFIVNINNATSTDYIKLIEHIQKHMLEKFGYTFEVEPRIVGEIIKRID